MRFLPLFLILSFIFVVHSDPKDNIFSSIFGKFGKKRPTTTQSPFSSGSSRCNSATNQCSAYECCNSDQTCIKNRCFPRLTNCPVTRDQCGNSCCKTSEICRNGMCVR